MIVPEPIDLPDSPRALDEWCSLWAVYAENVPFEYQMPVLDSSAMTRFHRTWAEYRQLRQERESAGDETRSLLDGMVEEVRLAAREFAAELMLLPAGQVHLAALNADGFDEQLAALFSGSGSRL